MHASQAWEVLNDRNRSGRLPMGEFYDLLLRAGFQRDEAQRLANQRGWERLNAGEML